ncbi:XdhC family protein [Pantoea rwandensis]|uniref:XshC-Cox1 family protein n=1 Tax=Pantoea rwandensis TaxID=1076550 RepID=A0A1X1D518_9GAMM|nr:XdhC family protein [Pantoea rwandensis]ORM71779.1 XshC-Cox1 family protein [Pantoea rwandensis]
MQHLDVQLIVSAKRWVRVEPIWLCTVLSTFGSSPRPPGTMMVISLSGHVAGSLSGGCIEEDFITRIQSGELKEFSQIVRYGEGGLTPDKKLPCGGIIDILVERLSVTEESSAHLDKIHSALLGFTSLVKHIQLPEACASIVDHKWISNTQVSYTDKSVTINIANAPKIIIAGLSTVAAYCAEFAATLGFEVIICESRKEKIVEFQQQIRAEIKIEPLFPARYIELHGAHSNTAIVALTHDAKFDDLTMMEAVNTEAFYLGVMGSKRTSTVRLKRLIDIGGLDEEEISRIHAPVGLSIGSKTPAEIGLSIMADIVRAKNEIHQKP